jgi:hypothetical protein
MKATTSTALPLLVGLGLALPAAAAQEGAGTAGGRSVTAGAAITAGEQRFLELAGGEEGMTRERFPGAGTGVQDAGAAARQQAPRTTEPAAGTQGERPRALQTAQAGAGAGQGRPATLGTAATGVRTNAVEVALSEETIQGTYFMDAGRVGLPGGGMGLSLLLSDDRDLVASGSVMAPNVLANVVPGPLSLSIGGKVYAAFLDDPSDDVLGIAPGVEGRYALPFGLPAAVVANVFYAPEIITFGEADNVLDFNVRFEVQATSRVVGFVGYRLLEFDRDNGDDQIVDNVQFGVRFAF